MKQSIKRRLLRTFLIALGLLVVISCISSFYSLTMLKNKAISISRDTGARASLSSEDMLTEQALSSVESFVMEKADSIQKQIYDFVLTLREMADYVSYLYEHPDEFVKKAVKTPDELLSAGADLSQPLMHWLPDLKSRYTEESVLEELSVLGNMEPLLRATLVSAPEFSSKYFSTPTGISIGMDTGVGGKTGIYEYDTTKAEWYTAAAKMSAETGETYISDTYEDSFGRGLCVTISVPVTANGVFKGVLGADLLIGNINEQVLKTTFGDGGYALLCSAAGKIIAMPDLDKTDENIDKIVGKSAAEAILSKDYGYELTEVNGAEVYAVYAPIKETGWRLSVLLPKDSIIEPAVKSAAVIGGIISGAEKDMTAFTEKANILLLIMYAVIGILLAFVIRKLCIGISRPLVHLTEDVRKAGSGELDYKNDINTGDEVEVLGKSFEQMTVSLKQYIENLTSVTAEKERIGAELSVASNIQASMLPCIFPPFPERAEFDLFASMHPAKEVGGDFYDFFLTDEDHLAVVMADVSGKGVPAALFMVIAKTLIKNHAQAGLPVNEVFTLANQQLCENNGSGLFVTGWMGLYEISTGRFTYVNAGHNPPLLMRAGGSFEYLRSRPGFVLAGMDGVKYRINELWLNAGDKLFLYTDGVTEAMDTEHNLYGDPRLEGTVNSVKGEGAQQIVYRVRDDVAEFAGAAPQADDITMLCLSIVEQGSGKPQEE